MTETSRLDIVIGANGAVAGAKQVEDALERIQKRAAEAIEAIAKLNAAKIAAGRAPAARPPVQPGAPGMSTAPVQVKPAFDMSKVAAEAMRISALRTRLMKQEAAEASKAKAAEVSSFAAAERRKTTVLGDQIVRRMALAKARAGIAGDANTIGAMPVREFAPASSVGTRLRDANAMARLQRERDAETSRAETTRLRREAEARVAAERAASASRLSGAASSIGNSRFQVPGVDAGLEARAKSAQAALQAAQQAEAAMTGTAQREATRRVQIAKNELDEILRLRQKEAAALTALARQQDRARIAGANPSSSAAHVGPLPETNAQASSRMQKDLSPRIDTDKAARELENLNHGFQRVQASAMSLNGVLAAVGAGVLIRNIAQTGMAFQSLHKGLEIAAGSAVEGGKDFARLKEESNRLGLNVLDTGKEYVNFVAAVTGSSVNLDKAKDTFFAMGQAMALLGRGPEQSSRAFKALEQFASKGQIMSEELKGQLAEQLPGAFAIAAKSLDMSTSELNKALESGSVSARRFFDVFAAGLNDKFNVDGKIDLARASFARFTNALDEAKNTIANGGLMEGLAKGAERLTTFLNSADGKKIATEIGGALGTAVQMLTSLLQVLMDNIETVKMGFMALVGIKVVGWIAEIVAAVGLLATTFKALGLAIGMTGLGAFGLVAAAAIAGLGALHLAVTKSMAAYRDHATVLEQVTKLTKDLTTAKGEEKTAIENNIKSIRDEARADRQAIDERIKKRQKLYDLMQAHKGEGGLPTAQVVPEGEAQALANANQIIAKTTPRYQGAAGTSMSRIRLEDIGLYDKETAKIKEQTAELLKQAEAFSQGAQAAADLKREKALDSYADEFRGRLPEAQIDQLKTLKSGQMDMEETIKVGPDIANLVDGIAHLDRLTTAHQRGVDAALAEKNAQEARNIAVRNGVSASGAASNALRELIGLQRESAANEMMSAQRASADRAINLINRTQEIKDRKSGLVDRTMAVETEAGLSKLVEQGVPGAQDLGPTKRKAGVLETAMSEGQKAVAEETARVKELNRSLEVELKYKSEIAKTGSKQSEANARRAGELQARMRAAQQFGDGNFTPEQEKSFKLAGDVSARDWRISQMNKTGATNPFGEKRRELSQQIEEQQGLAAAYDQGTEAVENQQRKLTILAQVQGLSEKMTAAQKAELEGLIGTLFDVKAAAEFGNAKFDLQNEISEVEALTRATEQGVEATNTQIDAQAALAKAMELGQASIPGVTDALKELYKQKRLADQNLKLAEGVADDRRAVEQITEETAALYKLGEERAREMAMIAERNRLIAEGVDVSAPELKEKVGSALGAAGDRATAEYRQASEQELRSSIMTTESLLKQRGALNTLGEERIRRMAEIQKTTELEIAGKSATDELGRAMVEAAGNAAVSADRLQKAQDGLDQLANSGLTMTQQMRELANSGLMHLEDGLVDLIMGTKSVKEAFADMARSIAQDLARMAIRQAITIPLAGMLGMGMMHSGGIVGTPGGATRNVSLFHRGGIVGAPGGMSRALPKYHSGGIVGSGSGLSALASLPRFHAGGLAADEEMAVLRKGEGVFTREQMQAMAPVGSGQGGGGGGAVVISPNITVQQPPGATPQQGEAFGKAITRQIEDMVNSQLQKQMRNGGTLNPHGYR